MEEDYKIIDHYLMIRLPEEIDHHSCSVICRRADHMMLDNSVSHIVFDFSDTKFMDSSGICRRIRQRRYDRRLAHRILSCQGRNLCPRLPRTYAVCRRRWREKGKSPFRW